MRLLPFERFSIDTTLALAAASERLSQRVAEAAFPPAKTGHQPFVGWVRPPHFRIQRAPDGRRNSFVPVVRGQIVVSTTGSRLEGTMELHRAVFLLMIAWVGFMSFALGGLAIEAVQAQPRWSMLLQVSGALAGATLLCLITFRHEVARADDLLRSLLVS